MEATITVANKSLKDLSDKVDTHINKADLENKVIPIKSLSEMTGFPTDFIKKELLLNQDELSMNDLRKSMAIYLENTIQQLK